MHVGVLSNHTISQHTWRSHDCWTAARRLLGSPLYFLLPVVKTKSVQKAQLYIHRLNNVPTTENKLSVKLHLRPAAVGVKVLASKVKIRLHVFELRGRHVCTKSNSAAKVQIEQFKKPHGHQIQLYAAQPLNMMSGHLTDFKVKTEDITQHNSNSKQCTISQLCLMFYTVFT